MSEFVFLFRTTEADARQAMGSPEQMQKSMEAWAAWMKGLAEKGHIKDPGQPLERTGRVVKGRDKTITDGPFAETKDIVVGFTVVHARDLAEAAELAKGCPMLQGAGAVEVRPAMQMNR